MASKEISTQGHEYGDVHMHEGDVEILTVDPKSGPSKTNEFAPMGKGLKSAVWKHMTKVTVAGQVKAVCNYCNKKLCYHCHQLGHFQSKCPDWDKKVNYAEFDDEDEMLLMAFVETETASKDAVWFLDSGCSNYMCGEKTWFLDLDETYRHFVKLGNNSRMEVMGKGSVRLSIEGMTHTIANVYFVPELRSNLLSIGQLQERGLSILIQRGTCKIFHAKRGLIMQARMSANRMFCIAGQS